jgi:hypothetical protein
LETVINFPPEAHVKSNPELSGQKWYLTGRRLLHLRIGHNFKEETREMPQF